MRTILLALLFALVPALSSATTYYVRTDGGDSNTGLTNTSGGAWLTISKCATTLIAGDSCEVQAGTYNERVTSITNAGTSGSPITFLAAGTVTMKGFAVNKAYIVINGFTVTNIGSVQAAILVSASHVQILNNHTDARSSHSDPHEIQITAGSPDVATFPTNIVIQGNHLQHSLAGNTGDYTLIHAYTVDTLIDDNELGPAIDADSTRLWGYNITVSNNYIHDFTYVGPNDAHMDSLGQLYGDGSGNPTVAYNIYYEGNRVLNIDAGGASGKGQAFNMSWDSRPDIRDIWIRNNVFAHVNLQGNIGIPGSVIANNTFYDCGAYNGQVLNVLHDMSGWNATGMIIRNNIFINASNYYVYAGGGVSVATRDHNYAAYLPSFAAVGGFTDGSSVNGGNPQFVNATDHNFMIGATSPAKDAGVAISGWATPTDYAGTVRPQGSAWDIGAYEVVSNVPSPPTNVRIR